MIIKTGQVDHLLSKIGKKEIQWESRENVQWSTVMFVIGGQPTQSHSTSLMLSRHVIFVLRLKRSVSKESKDMKDKTGCVIERKHENGKFHDRIYVKPKDHIYLRFYLTDTEYVSCNIRDGELELMGGGDATKIGTLSITPRASNVAQVKVIS